MIAGFLATGVNLFDLGIGTTPIVRYALATLGAGGGVHLRVSPRNGDSILVEFLDEKGFAVSRDLERKIEQRFFTEEYRRIAADRIGEVFYVPHLLERYLEGVLSATSPQRSGMPTLKRSSIMTGGSSPFFYRPSCGFWVATPSTTSF